MLWGVVALVPLLGLTWILGLLFLIDSDSVALAWIFTIVNSLQVLVHTVCKFISNCLILLVCAMYSQLIKPNTLIILISIVIRLFCW